MASVTSESPILLRSVARALEAHLHTCEDTNIHWVGVIGESSLEPRPQVSVPRAYFDDVRIQVALAVGHSEGSLITVYGQPDRYDAANVRPLLLVKTLSGVRSAAREVGYVLEWFEAGMPGFQ